MGLGAVDFIRCLLWGGSGKWKPEGAKEGGRAVVRATQGMFSSLAQQVSGVNPSISGGLNRKVGGVEG